LIVRLLIPILAVEESSGLGLMIPAGATIAYESSSIVFGVADLRWDGETYFANLEEVLESSAPAGRTISRPPAWVN
jgi:hypothetical protein